MRTTLTTREDLQSLLARKLIQRQICPPALGKVLLWSSLCFSKMDFASLCRVVLPAFLLFNLTLILIILRCNSSKCLSQFSHRTPTPARATVILATPTDIAETLSNLPTSSRLQMVISKHTIVLRLKIELNNNKLECIMENHKLHIWFHPVLTTAKFFQTAKYLFLKYLDSLKYQVNQAWSTSNMVWWVLVLTTPWWLISNSHWALSRDYFQKLQIWEWIIKLFQIVPIVTPSLQIFKLAPKARPWTFLRTVEAILVGWATTRYTNRTSTIQTTTVVSVEQMGLLVTIMDLAWWLHSLWNHSLPQGLASSIKI